MHRRWPGQVLYYHVGPHAGADLLKGLAESQQGDIRGDDSTTPDGDKLPL